MLLFVQILDKHESKAASFLFPATPLSSNSAKTTKNGENSTKILQAWKWGTLLILLRLCITFQLGQNAQLAWTRVQKENLLSFSQSLQHWFLMIAERKWLPRHIFVKKKKDHRIEKSTICVPGHVMRCDNELQDINAKVRKNESATAQFEISQNRNFQKKTKPLEPQNSQEWFDAKT